ncbi:uncharacterized protein [Diadema antillarum]|uniref:uncharacterized protein n=1 Tax=Diadema antillarum TaxID=105358 RepID=UPI003A8A17D9
MCRALCKASSTAASVLLSFFQTVISTTTSPTGYTDENGTEEPSGGGGHIAAIAAVVAVIVVLLVCVAIYFCLRRRGCTLPYHRAESHGYVGLSKGSQERSVTFLELWYFVSSREDEDFLKPLRSLVSGLRTNGVSRGEELLRSDMSQQDIMSELFVWKEDYRGKNQMKDLLESCAKYNLTDEVGVMQEYRKKPFPISPNMIKRIIWAIDNRDKIKAVFSTLKIPLQPLKRVEDAFADVENLRNVGHQTKRRGDNKLFMATAIEEVIKWSHQPFEMNPRVLLAMALESNDCTPIDRTFFIDEGPISYVELWEIAQHSQGEAYWSQVADLAYHLTADETSKQPPLGRISVDVAYEQLCGWKSSCNNDHQKDLLLAALERNGLTAACSHVKEFRMNVTDIIGRKMAKCLISAMEKEESIRRVLEELEFSDYFQNNSGEEDIWTAATNRLEAWGNEEVTMNRLVSLSLALERADCTPIDQEFLAGGPLSYLELWEFVRVDDRPDHVARIISIVDSLTDDHSTHTASAEGSSVDYGYSKLCEWKKTSSKPYQRGMLHVALKMNGLAEAAEQLRDYRKPLETTIDDNVINCIVWTLKNDARLHSFLDQLGVSLTETVEGKDISLAAVEHLRSWTEQPFTENPLVLFSLGLENAGCSPNECNFLKGGPISFIELWELANADFGESYFGQLVAVVQMLNGDANEVTSKPDSPRARQELYQQLCTWKEACSKNYQRDVLTAALIKEGLETALSHIEAYRSSQNNVLSDLELEHILWYTDDIPNLFANLKSIERDRQGGENAGKEGAVQRGTLNLHRWLHRKYTPNEISRVVQLDLALEESGSSPIDRNFIQVEKAAKSPVDADMLAAQLTEVHISKLMAALSSGAAKESKSAEVICKENDESLFNVSQMIRDWLAKQGCSHYEKRKRLWLAARQIGRGDIAGDDRT